ncbi:MAG: peptidylprolyl isomerase [Bacteroidota bacterium]
MKKINHFLLGFITLLALSCKSEQPLTSSDNDILFTVDGSPVTAEEFMYVYKKNNFNNEKAFQREDIKDYLDLFVNFKLKIREAKALGMDTTASFNAEFNTYAEQLKKPYLTESGVTEKLINEAYQRMKEEVSASHILVRLKLQASPADTLKAYNRLLGVREQAVEGKPFEQLARQFSQDPSARNNGGNLGYFTAFQMVYPFESAAYQTPVGDVSMPIRTRFGYHLVKVNDRRKSQGEVEVSHIMIRIKRGATAKDSTDAKNRVFEIHDQLQAGADWNELCKQFSEDLNTRGNGGTLKPFKRGSFPPTFEAAAFSLQNSQEISDPFTTPFGWHIVKLEGRKELETFEELEAGIKQKVNRDSRSQLGEKFLIKRLKNENGFQEYPDRKKQAFTTADSSLLKGKWTYRSSAPYLDSALFSIAEQPYTIRGFYDYIVKEQKPSAGYGPEYYMDLLYNNYVKANIIKYEEDHLAEKYVDYRMLLKEYREGILLFQLMDDKVWSKAASDSVGLANFFEKNKGQYKWEKRVDAIVYNAASKDIVEEIKSNIETDTASNTKENLEKKFNTNSSLNLSIEERLFEKGQSEFIDKVTWAPGQYEMADNDRYQLIIVKKVLEPTPKQLDEVKGLVISDYQDELEKEWVSSLKAKYNIETNDRTLAYVYDKLEKK